MKQTLALILIILLLCGMLAPSVLAAESSDSAETETSNIVTDSGSVISYTTSDALTGTFDMVCGDTGFTQLHNALDSVAISGTAEKDGTTYEISMSVTWDFSTVDAETPGSYTAVGSIAIPEGATLSDGLSSTVSIAVQVSASALTVSPAAITLTRFDEPDRTDAVAFAAGTTREELAAWFADSVTSFTGYDAEGNSYDLVPGAWTLDAIDTGTTGVYYASVEPDLGTGYTLADGVSLPRQRCAVSVQTPGKPDINCCVAGRGFLRFPWVLSSAQEEQLDEFAVWLRQDGGEWVSLSDGFLFVSDGLQLSQRIFESGSTYELKVTYSGGQTGVLTFQYDGELSILDYSGGDRDGGDAGGSNAGSGTQPAPTAPQTPGNSNDATQDSGSAPGEAQKPQESQDSTSGETEPAPTASQTPGDTQKNGNDNSDSNLSVQTPVTEKPAAGTPAVVAPSTVPVYSDVSHSHEAANASPEPENRAVSQPDNNGKAVLNPLPEENNTPSQEISKAQESAVVSESYSPTQTVISGLRLKDLCAGEENVVFGSGNLTVSIPSKLLLALDLSDTDTLTVTLTQPESNQIMLAVTASGQSVAELTGTVLRLRYMTRSKNTEITVQNEMGEQITDTTFDGELLRFTADSAGTFTIMELSNTQEPQKSVPPLLPVSGGLILAVGGITFFRRRRHG